MTARIVSLLPSATEIIYALGYGEQIVARSHECDYPPDVRRRPVATAPRFDADGSSREIDQRVRALAQQAREARAQDALGVYDIDTDLLRGLRPTHIVTQTQCEVCAVSLRDVERAVALLSDNDARLIPLAPNCLDDIWDDIRRTADSLGDPGAGRLCVDALSGRIDALAEQIADAVGDARQPTVAVVEWADPLMTAGHWTMELVARAGAQPVLGEPRGPSLQIDLDQLEAADPDQIIIAPCGYGLDLTRRDAELLRQEPRWNALRAVREGRVALIDGNQYVNRPGPRVVETFEIIAEILHPERFDFGHRGAGWEPEQSRQSGAEESS